MIFPATPPPPSAPLYTTQAPGSVIGQVPTSQPTLPTFDPYSYPAAQPPAFNPYGATPYYAQPAYTAPAPNYGSQGIAYPDPYTGTANNPGGYATGAAPNSIRVLQDVRFQETYLPRNTGNGFGMHDLEAAVSFGFPVFPTIQQPILLTPGFTLHLWDGPDSVPGTLVDMPNRAYDAYLMTSWRPQFNQMFGADLAVSVGVYSDFQYTSTQSIRVLGRGLGLVTISPKWQAALGVWYLNRISVKLLPAGGLIWTPHPDTRYELIFPNPKLAQRINTWGNTDIWGYVAGEYGGGAWTVLHVDGTPELVNYNDLRLILGSEFINLSGWRANLEVGYAFNREILYNATGNRYVPPDTVLFRGQIRY